MLFCPQCASLQWISWRGRARTWWGDLRLGWFEGGQRFSVGWKIGILRLIWTGRFTAWGRPGKVWILFKAPSPREEGQVKGRRNPYSKFKGKYWERVKLSSVSPLEFSWLLITQLEQVMKELPRCLFCLTFHFCVRIQYSEDLQTTQLEACSQEEEKNKDFLYSSLFTIYI